MKEKNLQFIKKFNKITLIRVCNKLHINYANLLNGRCSEENVSQVVQYLKFLIKELEDDDNE